MRAPGPVLVMGAGSIGCFVGGRLAAAGAEVHFVARPRVLDALRAGGLRLTDLDAPAHAIPASSLHLHAEPSTAPAPALALLCVKSGGTAPAAEELQRALPPGTPVLSLQNGVGNADLARSVAPALNWLAGMVAFNVAEVGAGQFHRGTQGEIAAQSHPRLEAFAPLFAAAGLPLQLHGDLRPVQWSKLLLNLNNPVNALSGLPLRAQLLDPSFRRATAALQEEALQVLQSAGIAAAQITPLPPRRIPWVLRLPTPLFRLIASRMLRIDARARSSMADDLALGRATEIDALCGEIVRLADRCGVTAPLNSRMVQLVQQWPQRGQSYSGAELLAALTRG